jgi:hypothetical protein
MHAAAACTIALAIHLAPGAHVVQRSSYDDRIAWVLPPDKLAGFERSGVVIDEDKQTTILAHATVGRTDHELMTLQGTLETTARDVPRHRVTHSFMILDVTVTSRNESVPARVLDVEEAPMANLPEGHLCVGQTWRTRMPVVTSLGSGSATIDHRVVRSDGRNVEIAVKGFGVISGLEYNLPRLLPGGIEFSGTARFDPASGAVTREHYVVRNRLIRTVKGKTIGFLETETVQVVLTISPAKAPRPPHTARRTI